MRDINRVLKEDRLLRANFGTKS